MLEYRKDYVARTFRTRKETDLAYNDLIERGYIEDEIDVLMSDKTRDTFIAEDIDSELGNKVAEDAGKGSLIGGGIGAVVGAIATIGTNVIFPVLGLIVAGPLAVDLAGAGTVAGGLIGALTSSGVPEEDAKHYHRRIEDGDIYLGVKPRSEEEGRVIYDTRYDRNL
ncbi:hypothetical protein GO491_03775 [Flavobacteriaceae bacterium Ap0902]|nr:hypothetical protein [Flavobacteriaceae bacterium Ap0902]